MEAIEIKAVNGKKDEEFAVLYKQGRKILGWTQRDRQGMWCNYRRGFGFSASEELSRAVDIMEEHLRDILDPFGTKQVTLIRPEQ